MVLEFAPPAKPYLVGMTDGMVQVLDRSTRFGYRGGYATEYGMESLLRASVVSTVYGGTSEIQRDIIGKTYGL